MKDIILTQSDFNTLNSLVSASSKKTQHDFFLGFSMNELKTSLAKAEIVTENEFPTLTVSLNSAVQIRPFWSNEVEEVRLVLPAEADPMSNKISVLSPFGWRLLGESKGSSFTFYNGLCLEKFNIVDVQKQENKPH